MRQFFYVVNGKCPKLQAYNYDQPLAKYVAKLKGDNNDNSSTKQRQFDLTLKILGNFFVGAERILYVQEVLTHFI